MHLVHEIKSSSHLHWIVFIFIFYCGHISHQTKSADSNNDVEIDPYKVREDGCPIVTERNGLNITKLSGNWRMPFASLNWLADIGMALYNHSVSMNQITAICPRIEILHKPDVALTSNETLSIKYVCPKLHGEFTFRCGPQHNSTLSKFNCFNRNEQRDLFMMVAATDHTTWIVLIRCSPAERGQPTEGMSWAILSKEVPLASDVADVLFGLLDGYGFDVDEFKTQLLYNDCPPMNGTKSEL